MDEGTELTFAAVAADSDVPADTLTFSLGAGAPAGASITSGGVFSWTPAEAQGPGIYAVTIQVSDDGEGISTQDLPYIFDRFWRGDRGTGHGGGSSGLGLAITRQLVRAHGGRISVESTPGRGTTFTVDLPGS